MKRLLWGLAVAAAIVLVLLLETRTVEAPQPETPPAPTMPPPQPRETEADAAAWNTYHGDAGLTGFSPLALPEALRLAWVFRADAPVLTTPVASGEQVYFADTRGTIYAVTPEGTLAWSSSPPAGVWEDGTPRPASFDAPLAYFDGMLYACDANGLIIALDAATGRERWRHALDIPVVGSPNYGRIPDPRQEGSRGVVFVIGQDNGTLHAFDAESGERLWATEGVSRSDGSPGVGDNHVVFGSCDSALHIFAAESGTMEHTVPIPGDSQVASGVAVFQGYALSGCRSGKLVRARLSDGATIWTTELTGSEIFGTPAVNGALVVITAEDGCVHAASFETGAPGWKACIGDMAHGAVIAGDKVVATADGSLFLLRLEDGAILWRRELADELTGPAIAGGLILAGADDGTVPAFVGDAH